MAFNSHHIVLILRYRDRKIAVPRGRCHNFKNLISFALLSFGFSEGISVDDVVLLAKIPGLSDPDPVEITPELWPAVSHVVDGVVIMLKSERDSPKYSSTVSKSSGLALSPQKAHPSPFLPNLPTFSSTQHPPSNLLTCQDSLTSRQTLPMSVSLPQLQNHGSTTSGPQVINVNCISTNIFRRAPPPFSIYEDGLLGQKVSYLCERIQTRIFGNMVISDLRFGSLSLDRERTLTSYTMYSESTVTATLVTKQPQICKSTIYLYPPVGLADATVKLTLVPSWNFSDFHPEGNMVYAKMSITWNVAAEPNGTLVEKNTGMELSYLHWEAHADSKVVTYTSPTTNPMAKTGTFDPLNPSVNPGDSVLLPNSKLPEYLDAALKALAPDRKARDSFIQYWLPDMQKHNHIALRFVTQDSWEKAAAMHITPTPDIVTRIFMLFRGVTAGDLSRWGPARMRAAEPGAETFWADVVGVDAASAEDRGLFRVLEWAAMEVN